MSGEVGGVWYALGFCLITFVWLHCLCSVLCWPTHIHTHTHLSRVTMATYRTNHLQGHFFLFVCSCLKSVNRFELFLN